MGHRPWEASLVLILLMTYDLHAQQEHNGTHNIEHGHLRISRSKKYLQENMLW